MIVVNEEGTWWLTSTLPKPSNVYTEWRKYPARYQQLPLGRTFDILDISCTDGINLLHTAGRAQFEFGPICTEVTATEARMLLFIRPGSLPRLPETFQGRYAHDIDIKLRNTGTVVVPPLERETGSTSAAEWIIPPMDNPPRLPSGPHALDRIIRAADICAAQYVGRAFRYTTSRRSSG